MAIIKSVKGEPFKDGLKWQVPDQFVSDKVKESHDYWKSSMDYFSTLAMAQYSVQTERVVPNYKLLNGFLSSRDFFLEQKNSIPQEAKSLMDTLEEDLELPADIQHFSIFNSPINTMLGEMSKRPDNPIVKAFDDDSKSEQGQALTEMYQRYAEQVFREKVTQRLQAQNQDTSDIEALQEEIETITEEQMKEFRVSYTTLAERWGNKMLENLKMNFNLKQKSEEAFRDLLITSTEYIHIQPNGSKIGFGVTVENPRNVGFMMSNDKKSTKDAYIAWTIHVMEISEILEKYPFLTKAEVDRMNEQARAYYGDVDYTSPALMKNPKTGVFSIDYHVYDPAVELKRQEIEYKMMNEALNQDLGLSSTASHYGNMFVVVKAYWKSKKKMGKLKYYDEDGIPQTTLVDENYSKIPEEISIEWGYINQWYEGLKIGEEIYYVQPLEILPYCPIIGVIHNNKNTQPASLVDLMKPFQMIYNVLINQLYRLAEKDTGKVFLTDIRQVPTPKDGNNQDALDQWILDVQELGFVFLDNSPDNTKGPSNFNQHGMQDMSRADEMQARMQLAQEIKNECWELVGINRQRQGNILSSDTVGGTNTAMSQSYAQTETYFLEHEYLWNDVYQALLDAAMFIEMKNPESTLSFITSEGESIFLKLNREELLRDLQVFVTSRGEDQQILKELRMLSQPMLQNGAGFDVIAEMYLTKSTRTIQENIKSFQKKKEAFEAQQNQIKQQELQQQQAQFEESMAQAAEMKAAEVENDNYNKDLDRINKKEVAIISALGFGKQSGEDANSNGVPDLYEIASLEQSGQKIHQDHQIAIQKQQLENQQQTANNAMKQEQINLQKEKVRLEEKRIESQERIEKAKIKAKPKPTKKK